MDRRNLLKAGAGAIGATLARNLSGNVAFAQATQAASGQGLGGRMGSDLKAGVARADITPSVGLLLWGYPGTLRLGPAQGTRDPLYARVLALESGPARIAIVTVDLGRCFPWHSIQRLREAARKSDNVAYVLIAAIHTHSAPDVAPLNPSPQQQAWEESALEKIGEAIHKAFQNLENAQIGTGYGTTYIGHNRLRHNPNGTTTWFMRNSTQIPTAPIDPTVSVLRIDNSQGTPIAILVNYACHAVVFGPDNMKYSADYPGVMDKFVEDSFDGKPLCFFLQGAAGDINPFYAVTPLKEDAVHYVEWTGRHLGQEATRVAKAIRTKSETPSSISFAEDLLMFHPRWNVTKYLETVTNRAARQEIRESMQQDMLLPISSILINKRIALLGLPGEPFVNFQVNWRDRCPTPDAFFLGYSNGYFGYFPTIHAATEGGYGAGSSSTWVEVGAGERMVDHGLIRIYKKLGRLYDLPSAPVAQDDLFPHKDQFS